MRRAAAALALAGLLAGCGSLTRLNRAALPLYEGGLLDQAADALPPMPEEGGKDRLLSLYDRGMILHAARRFEASNEALMEAARLAERIELIGFAERSGTIVTNENFVDYRGEDYERVLCHTLATLNYLALDSVPDALVECRRALEVHKKIRAQRGKDEQINAFALYLSGLCYELSGQSNDALIDYQACYELAPSFPPLPDDLLRLTKALGMVQEHADWVRRFGRDAEAPPPGTGEVVAILEAGRAPTKIPGGLLGILPDLEHQPSWTASATLQVDGVPLAPTVVLNDVEAWARATLEERADLLLAKRVAILAGKEVVAELVDKRYGESWANITRILLFALERPDLRYWRSLPQTFQACRVRVKAGTHDLVLQPVDAEGRPSAEALYFPGTEIRAGQVVVLVARAVQ